MTSRTVCPVCGGGRSKERSCLVYDRSGVEFYKCFRASCPQPYGVWHGGNVQLTSKTHTPTWPSLMPLPPERMRWLASKFLLSNSDLARLRALWTGDRYWYPIRDAQLQEQGGIARSYWKTPKALTYTHDWGCGAWYPQASDTIWVVEDQVSACKMAEHHTTCALLGVSVAAACRDALASSGKRIVVALDGDAFYQSTKISEQLQRVGCDVQVVKLDRDIKNLDQWEVRCLSTRT